jgi:hypothetical protein
MGCEVRILKRQGRYIVKIYPDADYGTDPILSRSDADFNKAQMKAYYALLDKEGLPPEEIKAMKKDLKDALDKLNEKPLCLVPK